MKSFSGRGLHGRVVNELALRIVRDQLVPGSTIDPEAVAQEFRVSRTVVREALKVLAAKGLVGARPRYGTYVTDRENWQLLDADVMSWRAADHPEVRLVTELEEVRWILEPAGARLAAARRTDAQLDRIGRAWDQLDRSYRADDPDRPNHEDADLEFHRSILAAAGNELLERFEVILEPALKARNKIAHQHMTTLDFLSGHQRVYQAIVEADPDAAQTRMRSLMELSAMDSAEALRHPTVP